MQDGRPFKIATRQKTNSTVGSSGQNLQPKEQKKEGRKKKKKRGSINPGIVGNPQETNKKEEALTISPTPMDTSREPAVREAFTFAATRLKGYYVTANGSGSYKVVTVVPSTVKLQIPRRDSTVTAGF